MANIIWMPSAKDTYAEILEQLELEAALKLDDEVEKLLEKLQTFTHICPPSQKLLGFRKCSINKIISMIYSTDQKTIYVIAFYYNKSRISF